MVGWVLRWTVICLMGSMLLCAAMIALGSTQPPHPALRGFSVDCEEAAGICWHGIIPGETSLTSARGVMQQLGYEMETGNLYSVNVDLRQDVYLHAEQHECGIISLIYTVSFANPRITIGTFSSCAGLTVGDVIGAFGTPVGVGFDRQRGRLVFSNHAIAEFSGALTPYTPIERLWISLVGGVSYGEWHGFRTRWGYPPDADFR